MAGKQKKGRPPAPVLNVTEQKAPMVSQKLKKTKKTSRGK